jgi:hypothetical protein
MTYLESKLIIGINELYCPGKGWIPASQYQPSIHGIPSAANVKCVDHEGRIHLQADLTEEEYKSFLAFPASEGDSAPA